MFVRIQLAQHIFQRGEEGVVFFLCADADAQMIRQLIAAERADDEAAFEQGLKAGFGIGAVVIGAAEEEVCMAGPDGKAEIAQALRQAATFRADKRQRGFAEGRVAQGRQRGLLGQHVDGEGQAGAPVILGTA